jgi:hypothetical protein
MLITIKNTSFMSGYYCCRANCCAAAFHCFIYCSNIVYYRRVYVFYIVLLCDNRCLFGCHLSVPTAGIKFFFLSILLH